MNHIDYQGDERRADTWGRRDHDDNCEQNKEAMREWVRDKICIATKGTKAKQVLMWSVMTIMLIGSLSSAYKSISAAESATEVHTRNTSAIAHNKEAIGNTEKDLDSLAEKVDTMEERQIIMYGDIKTVLGILESERDN